LPKQSWRLAGSDLLWFLDPFLHAAAAVVPICSPSGEETELFHGTVTLLAAIKGTGNNLSTRLFGSTGLRI